LHNAVRRHQLTASWPWSPPPSPLESVCRHPRPSLTLTQHVPWRQFEQSSSSFLLAPSSLSSIRHSTVLLDLLTDASCSYPPGHAADGATALRRHGPLHAGGRCCIHPRCVVVHVSGCCAQCRQQGVCTTATSASATWATWTRRWVRDLAGIGSPPQPLAVFFVCKTDPSSAGRTLVMCCPLS
jgi:hypothetical protein